MHGGLWAASRGGPPTPGPRAAYTLAYNRAGQRLAEDSTVTGDPSNGSAATGYDPLGRLTSYSLPSLGKTHGATWQAVPNRVTLATDGIPATTPFDHANRPTGGGFGADADGRTTARPGKVLAWDSLAKQGGLVWAVVLALGLGCMQVTSRRR